MKRVFDLISSGIGLVLAVPLIGSVALLIKATSHGPVFFRQDRVGINERIFKVYKFRTIVNRAEAMGTSVTAGNDPRITPIGRVLRRTKLDELPQLINVFKGDMSLVGPRPDVPEIVDNYSKEMRRRITPGGTFFSFSISIMAGVFRIRVIESLTRQSFVCTMCVPIGSEKGKMA